MDDLGLVWHAGNNHFCRVDDLADLVGLGGWYVWYVLQAVNSGSVENSVVAQDWHGLFFAGLLVSFLVDFPEHDRTTRFDSVPCTLAPGTRESRDYRLRLCCQSGPKGKAAFHNFG